MTGAPRVWIVRHGETEWSRDGRHTGRTDVELTGVGEEQAKGLVPLLGDLQPDLVLCSPLRRAMRTAELAGASAFEVADGLQEWDYGELEGRTTSDIRSDLPGWTIWTGPWPGGENDSDVARRADRLIGRLLEGDAERVLLVGHGHFSRVLAARWVGEAVRAGQWLELDTAAWSELGWDRGIRVLRHWNVPVLGRP